MDTRSNKLAGQVAIITGGGRGFGREIAHALANEGVKVAVVARSPDQLAETVALIHKAGGHAIAISADVTAAAAVNSLVEQVERQLGPVDLLVNNAGRLAAIGPVWEVDPSEWLRDVEVNLHGTFLCCHAVLKRMVPRGRGRIINFTSAAMPNVTAYDCSKVAVTRFTDLLASETHEHGISVFAITIGPTRTDMMAFMLESEAGRRWLPYLGKMVEKNWQPIELAGPLVVLLASGRADALSGRWITPNDDINEMLLRIEEIKKDGLYVWNVHSLKNER